MLEKTVQLDRWQKVAGKINSLIRDANISVKDVGKIFVMNTDETNGILITHDDLQEYNIEDIGGWREIDELDVLCFE